MQDLHNNDLSIELGILDALVNDQSEQGDQYIVPVEAVRSLGDYVKASEVILILFDPENPGWANKKLLGAEQTWKSESAFLIKNSILCASLPENIAFIDYDLTANSEPDLTVLEEVTAPVRNIILAPLSVEKVNSGAILFVNPEIDVDDKVRFNYLQLIVKGLANAIRASERKRQLIVSKADLEATHWQILNSRNTLRTFFDNLPSSVYVIDRSYTIIAINNRRSERAGLSPQELVGEKCYEVLRGNPGPCASCHFEDALKGISSVDTLRELGPNDSFVHWEITTVPIREENNPVNGAIIFEEDVTEKWILEANLIQSEKMASIGQLAANVAHEINNPLAAIIANAQLLMHDLAQADEDIIDALKLIETAGNRAAKIVSSLLESARREKQDEFEEFSLNEFILDAVSMVNFEIKNRSIDIKLNLDEEMPEIFAHKNQLKGVWINLIVNALGAVENQRGFLSISTSHDQQEYRVVVSDNGTGISPEHQGHIFEPFFTTKAAGKGTGLGLFVSLQVVKEHHGNIEFVTEPGEGTTFIVTLPAVEPVEM